VVLHDVRSRMAVVPLGPRMSRPRLIDSSRIC
jgi:hypothetical protein